MTRLNLISQKRKVLHKAVTVTLCGGLGNQLFQYATARAVAIRCNAPLVLDLSWFDEVLSTPNVTPRKYALAPFSLPAHLVKVHLQPTNRLRSNRLTRLLGRLGCRLGVKADGGTFVESSYRFDGRVMHLHTPVHLTGYWQSPHYFSDAASQVRQDIGTFGELTDACVELLKHIRALDSICIHVRRGDYVSNKEASSFHGLCSLDYYKKGVNHVAQGLKSPHGFVFSDDPTWVREKLNLDIDFTVVDLNGVDQPHLDLWLMSACNHFVIANSSLSWWGAWLSSFSGKRVIAPVRWFSNPTVDTSDLIPDDWMRI